MSRYKIGLITSAPGTLAAFAILRATTRTLRIREIVMQQTQATESKIGLIVPKAQAITPSTSVVPVALDPRDVAATGFVDTAWTVAPALPDSVIYQAVADLAAVIGSGVPWTFPEPLVVPAGTVLGLFNFGVGAAGALALNVLWDE